jgi:hypothetical protein
VASQTTRFARRPATTITFFGVLPTSDAITFSSASAACSSASASVGSHRDPAPHLAVDLYRVLDAVLNQVGGVGNRERTVGQRRTRHFLGRVGSAA